MTSKLPTYFFTLSLVGLFLLGSSLPHEKEWTLKRKGNEMWVYTRDRAGSEIKEVRLIMHVDADIQTINTVLNDAERQTEWVYRCEDAKDLGGHIETGWYYYSRISMPWPMDDRDLIAKVVGGQNDGIYTSKSIAAPKYRPEVEGCVRLTDFDVSTTYEMLPSGGTKMTYDLHSEPGGAVPSWLVNMFVDKGPVETMTKLRDLVEKQ